MLKRFLLCSPDAAEGTEGEPTTDAAPPPAAVVVLNGERTERELQLQAELDAERQARESTVAELNTERQTRKQREVRLSELEDENHRIKEAMKPAPKAETKSWGFFN